MWEEIDMFSWVRSRIVICGIVGILVSQFFAGTAAAAPSSFEVWLKSHKLEFSSKPYIEQGVTLAPAQTLLEALEYRVLHDPTGHIVIGMKDDVQIQFTAGSYSMRMNWDMIELPLPPRIVDGEIYIPLRFLAELDGHEVRWDGDKRLIQIAPQNAATPVIAEKIRITVESDAGTDLDASWVAELEERIGASISWQLIPTDHYTDKTNVMIAAGDMGDILYVKNPLGYDPQMLSAVFRDLGPYLDKYPNLQRITGSHGSGLQLQTGEILGIPKANQLEHFRFPMIRQDWLDKLGFATPKTMHELAQVLDGFVNYDPDGNGKKDTYGLVGALTAGGMGQFSWIEYVFNEYTGRFSSSSEGTPVNLQLENGTRDALIWMNDAYKRGYVSPEFAVVTVDQVRQQVVDGKAGVVNLTFDEAAEINKVWKEAMPEARLVPLFGFMSDEGALLLPSGNVYAGMFGIPHAVPESRLPLILSALDAMLDASRNTQSDMSSTDETIVWSMYPAGTHEQLQSMVDQRELSSSAWDDQLPGWLTTTEKKALMVWNNEFMQHKIKFIMGIDPIDRWDAFIAKVKAND